MMMRTLSIATTAVLVGTLLSYGAATSVRNQPNRLVRLAELEIDPVQLDAYKVALRAEIETSIRIEPGVLTLYAVSLKDLPNQIRLFEMYASTAAYQTHLQSEHFKRYKIATAGMVKS